MKKLSLVVVLSLLFSMVLRGADYWSNVNPNCIRPISGISYVGIGTSNPGFNLDISGTIRATGKASFGGNVGIGTTSPQEKLHVNGSVRGNQSGGALRVNTSYGYVDIGPQNSSYAHFKTNRSRFSFNKEIRVDGGYIGSYNEDLSLRTQGTTRMTILNSNGNVGIGASNPGEKLVVNGNLKISGSSRKIIADGPGPFIVEGNPSGYTFGATVKLDQASHAYLYGGNGGGSVHHVILAHTGSQAWGDVGIGTDAPQAKLDVAGTVKMNGFKLTTGSPQNGDVLTYNNGEGVWQEATGGSGGDSYWGENDDGDIYCVGEYDKVGIMTTTPNSYLSVGGDGNSNYAIYGYNATGVCGKSIPAGSYYSATGVLGIGEDFGVKAEAYTGSGMGIGVRSGGHAYDFYAESSSGKSYFAGKVGIGTDDPQSELAVNGTITAKEIEVQLTGWPDFVFSDNYNLMPLKKLEKHIKKEKSLPGIPTNKEVEENGVKLGDMQAKLLQKVEELTLYVIEQDKKLSEQNKKLTRLESENKELKEQISRLEK